MEERFWMTLRFHLYGLSFICAGLGCLGGAVVYKLSNHIEAPIMAGLIFFGFGVVFYAIGLWMRNELG